MRIIRRARIIISWMARKTSWLILDVYVWQGKTSIRPNDVYSLAEDTAVNHKFQHVQRLQRLNPGTNGDAWLQRLDPVTDVNTRLLRLNPVINGDTRLLLLNPVTNGESRLLRLNLLIDGDAWPPWINLVFADYARQENFAHLNCSTHTWLCTNKAIGFPPKLFFTY